MFLQPWLHAWSECVPLTQLGQEATALRWLPCVWSKLTSQLLHQLLHTRLLEPGYLRSAQQRHFGEFSSTREHTITKPFQSGYIVNIEIVKAWKQLKITLLKHSTDYTYSRAFKLTNNMKYQNMLLLSLSPPLSFSLSLSHKHTLTYFLRVKKVIWKTGNTFLNNIPTFRSNKTVLHELKKKLPIGFTIFDTIEYCYNLDFFVFNSPLRGATVLFF